MNKVRYNCASRANNFCKCNNPSSIYIDMDDWGHWDVCSDCNKPIEDSYEYFNRYDGEDHDEFE